MGPESNDMYWEQSSCWSLEMSVEKLKAQGSSVAATLVFYNSKSVLRDGLIPLAQWSRRWMLSAFLQNIAIQGLQKPIQQKSIEFSFSFLISHFLSLWYELHAVSGLPCPGFQTVHRVIVIFSWMDCFPHPTALWRHSGSVPKPTKLPSQMSVFMLIGIIDMLLKELVTFYGSIACVCHR